MFSPQSNSLSVYLRARRHRKTLDLHDTWWKDVVWVRKDITLC